MACTPSPTSTLFGSSEFVSGSVSQSISTSISTVPPTTITTTTTSCPDSAASSTGTCSISTITSTIPGTTTTITDHVPITISVTLTSTFPTQTLFSTCPSEQPTQPPSNTDSSTFSSATNTDSQSVFTSASQSTLSDGQVSTVMVTLTSPPTQTVTASPSPGLNNSGNNSSTANSNLGPIIGGVLGGFFGLLLIAGAFICWRRRRRWDDIYEKGSIHGIDDDDRPVQAPEPAPYHYGLVGHHRNPSASPPSSPTSRPMTFHSRVESSGAVSLVSRESTVPLNIGETLTVPQSGHTRNPSLGNENLLLMRPLEPSQGSSLPDSRRSLSSNPPGSPTSPRQSYFPLRVTNADENDLGLSQAQSPKWSRQSSSQSPVLVHTDGGRLEGSSGVEATPPEDNPPAYSKRG